MLNISAKVECTKIRILLSLQKQDLLKLEAQRVC